MNININLADLLTPLPTYKPVNHPEPHQVGLDRMNQMRYQCPYAGIFSECVRRVSTSSDEIRNHISKVHFHKISPPFVCQAIGCATFTNSKPTYRIHSALCHPERCPIEGCDVMAHFNPKHPHEREAERIRKLLKDSTAGDSPGSRWYNGMMGPDREKFFDRDGDRHF